MKTNISSDAHKKILLQPAYILHTRPYQNTSLLIDAFTRSHGHISLVGKGVRTARSKYAGLLQVFNPLLISWSGRGELYTLTDAELNTSFLPSPMKYSSLKGKTLLSAYYLNELLLRFFHKEDAHPALFDRYAMTIHALGEVVTSDVVNIESILRAFEKFMLQEAGYGLVLDHDIETGEVILADQNYTYIIDAGPTRQQDRHQGIQIKGRTLLDLAAENFDNAETLKQAKRLTRQSISIHLGDKPLKTRELFEAGEL